MGLSKRIDIVELSKKDDGYGGYEEKYIVKESVTVKYLVPETIELKNSFDKEIWHWTLEVYNKKRLGPSHKNLYIRYNNNTYKCVKYADLIQIHQYTFEVMS